MAKGEEDKKNMQLRAQELETTINRQEEELSTERSDKLVFTEETARLRKRCDQMDEELRSFKESYEKVSEENKELVTKLSHYRINVLNETVYSFHNRGNTKRLKNPECTVFVFSCTLIERYDRGKLPKLIF